MMRAATATKSMPIKKVARTSVISTWCVFYHCKHAYLRRSHAKHSEREGNSTL